MIQLGKKMKMLREKNGLENLPQFLFLAGEFRHKDSVKIIVNSLGKDYTFNK
jgi:hypothetical protein